MYKEESTAIQQVIQKYFDGIFYGNTDKLQSVFHERALLFGDINDQPYLKTLGEYITGVKNRKSPSDNGETFRMKIIAIEILNQVAYVKLHCPMFEFNYYDYLALNRIDGNWLIVNKLFIHLSH